MLQVTGHLTQALINWMKVNEIKSPRLEDLLVPLTDLDSLSVEQWNELLEVAQALRPGTPVALEIGGMVQVNYTGVIGYLMLNCETLADAIETYVLCERHFYGVSFANLQCSDKQWSLSWPDELDAESRQIIQAIIDTNPLYVQLAISTLVSFLRKRFPGTCKLTAINLPGEPSADLKIYEDFYGCPVRFGSEQPWIFFDTQAIHEPAHGVLPGDVHEMRCQTQAAISNFLQLEDPFLHRLQHALLSLIPEGRATLDIVAGTLDCSPRTVQRRLDQHNLAYQQLLDGVREQLALHYLRQPSLRLVDLPLLLGYADQSTFIRAFKKWTGTTPAAYRTKMR